MELFGIAINLVAIAFLLTFLVTSFRSLRGGAPFIPTFSGYVPRMLALAGVGPGDVVYDLGCGDGRVVLTALRMGADRAIGYEISRFPLLLARVRAAFARVGGRASFARRNIRTCDVSDATLVYLYLMPQITNDLAESSLLTLRRGAKVLSAAFVINTELHPGFRLVRQERVGPYTAYLYERV